MSFHRLRRATLLTLAGLACSVAVAAPAQAAEPISVARTSSGFLDLIATGGDDNIKINVAGGTGTVTALAGGKLKAGPGCSLVGQNQTEVVCQAISLVSVVALGGNDTVTYTGSVPSSMGGGAGNDTLTGGSGDDMLNGGGDNDTLDGRGGFDRADGKAGSTDKCIAESRFNCEI